jgi:Tfp pilus assembly protein PilO
MAILLLLGAAYLKKSEMAITIDRLMAENKELKDRLVKMEKQICKMTGDDR